MSPCSNKSSENDGLEVHFGCDLESLWGQVGAKFDLRYVFFEVIILVLKVFATVPGRSRKLPGAGGGSLREL